MPVREEDLEARTGLPPVPWTVGSVARVTAMQHRFLGNSGLKVSEISYGNWITHGGQVEEDAARACVERALELGITTFDTADVYAGTRAEGFCQRRTQSWHPHFSHRYPMITVL